MNFSQAYNSILDSDFEQESDEDGRSTTSSSSEENENQAPPSGNRPSRSWCYTLNNWTEEEYEAIKAIACTYHVVGKEVGLNETPHLQGCVTLQTPVRFNAFRRLVPRAHVEIVRNVQASRTYAKKEGNFWESGECPGQGSRSDLKEAIATLKEERDLGVLATRHSSVYVKYHGGFGSLLRELPAKTRDACKVYWFFGPTGTGKTHAAVHSTAQEADVYITNGTLKWFDGFNTQGTVVFDDFRAKDTTFNWLLRLLDKYEIRVEVKGGTRAFHPRRIFVTTTQSPADTFAHEEGENVNQLLRRIWKIGEFSTVTSSDGGKLSRIAWSKRCAAPLYH